MKARVVRYLFLHTAGFFVFSFLFLFLTSLYLILLKRGRQASLNKNKNKNKGIRDFAGETNTELLDYLARAKKEKKGGTV